MKKAIILTATRGLGIKLAENSGIFNISSTTVGLTKKGLGESSHLPAHETDLSLNIEVGQNALNDLVYEINRGQQGGGYSYLVWNTGVFLQKPFVQTTDEEIDNLSQLHFITPLKIIKRLHALQPNPYHLIVIASCSSWRMRNNEAVYCGLCAAKATFTRNFANELTKDRPGSKVTLFNPGGLRTPFYYEDKEVSDIKSYLDQDNFSTFIWDTAINQNDPFQEIQFLRNKNIESGHSQPIVEYGSRIPETI